MLHDVHRRGLQVLLQRDQVAADLEVDDESRGSTHVDDLTHDTGRRVLALTGTLERVGDADLLGADAEDPGVAEDLLGRGSLQQVRGADEPRDEWRRGRS